TRKDLVTATHALDRLLQWGFYAVPHFANRTFWIVSWDKFGRPEKTPSPAYGIGQDSWWIDPAKLAAVQQRKASVIAAASTPSPAGGTPAATGASQPAAAPPTNGGTDRGQTPIYGALIGLIIGFALGRVGRRK
ncbi:MAG TPA: hypothetical protein VF920_06680, partial [Dongiaceae bacterium]